ncbi:MAG TPA: cytochrome c [Candidatus Limnocylindria bacterium]|nr:cytochrome c [Candidatus Limnocylindria bacterium]
MKLTTLGAVLLLGASTAAASAQTPAAPAAGDPHHGFVVYEREGCYECHGHEGQGNGRHGNGTDVVGPALAPNVLPFVLFQRQVRHPRDLMPIYSPRILSDADLADVYAYLKSRPAAKPPSSIPILNAIDTKSAH